MNRKRGEFQKGIDYERKKIIEMIDKLDVGFYDGSDFEKGYLCALSNLRLKLEKEYE
jgi:hypothetical protein